MSCNSSLIVLLALCAVLATPLLPLYNSPTLCKSLIENAALHRVGIHFHVLFKASQSIRSTLRRIELLLFCVSAADLFLADRIPGRGRWGDTTAFPLTAPSSLKTPKPADTRCRLWPMRWRFGLVPAFDGSRFDSLLPVSVRAGLNVNQGPHCRETWVQTNWAESSQVGWGSRRFRVSDADLQI